MNTKAHNKTALQMQGGCAFKTIIKLYIIQKRCQEKSFLVALFFLLCPRICTNIKSLLKLKILGVIIRLDKVPNIFNGGDDMDYSPKKKEYEYPRGSFFLLPLDIFERGLSVNAFAVYNVLAYMSDEHGQCFPSRMTIGNYLGGLSRPVVDKALKELEDKLMIGIEHRYKDNKQITNMYTLYDLVDKKDALNHIAKYPFTEDGTLRDYFEYY